MHQIQWSWCVYHDHSFTFDLSAPYNIERLRAILTLCADIQGSFCKIKESRMSIAEIDQPQTFELTQTYPFNMYTCAEKCTQ